MTVSCLISVKGAPGVTTLACLIGAMWPEGRRVAVIEADPFGGDLAARFQLSTTWGWSSFMTASRRSEGGVPLHSHLQSLPGGLEVLVLPGGSPTRLTAPSVQALLQSSESAEPAPWDLVVDGGRLVDAGAELSQPGDTNSTTGPWLDRADTVIIVTRRDPASILQVRHYASALRSRCGVRLHVALVGRGPHDVGAIEEFTGLRVIAEIPWDPVAAQVVTGEGGSARRLSRSLLVASTRRLAVAVAGAEDELEGRPRRAPIVVGRSAVSWAVDLLRRQRGRTARGRAGGATEGVSLPRWSSAPATTPSGALASDSGPSPASSMAASSEEATPDAAPQDVLS